MVGFPFGSRWAKQKRIWAPEATVENVGWVTLIASAFNFAKSSFKTWTWEIACALVIFSAAVLYTTWTTTGIVTIALVLLTDKPAALSAN